MTQPLETLTDINLDDLVSSFGWQARSLPAGLLRLVFRAPARKFARMMLAFDRVTAEKSLPDGARCALRDFSRGMEVYGFENLPTSGPILFLSNHPGMVDSLALFASINRPDLQVIALDRPFLRALPNVARHMIFTGAGSNDRLRALKQTANHLRAGGAVLTFPAGQIEPDPLVYPGALEALQDWTYSAGVFLRFAPETRIVPVLVSGVLWEPAVKFPLVRMKTTRLDREKLGASLQLLAHIILGMHPLKVRIQFSRPLTAVELDPGDLAATHRLVLERMRALLHDSQRISPRRLLPGAEQPASTS